MGGAHGAGHRRDRGAPGEHQLGALFRLLIPRLSAPHRCGRGAAEQHNGGWATVGGETTGVVLLEPGVVLLEPGVVLLDPGVVLLDPGVVLLDPGVVLLEPGDVRTEDSGGFRGWWAVPADLAGALLGARGGLAARVIMHEQGEGLRPVIVSALDERATHDGTERDSANPPSASLQATAARTPPPAARSPPRPAAPRCTRAPAPAAWPPPPR